MAITINNQRAVGLPAVCARILPARLYDEILLKTENLSLIEEIRLRCERNASLTREGRNIFLSYVATRAEMDDFVLRICNNSLYAYKDTISNGFVTLEGGIRVGLCGRASVDGKGVIGVYDVSSVNIRIPHPARNLGDPICRLLRQQKEGKGVLIYAPPGEGKTTLLRSVYEKMASGEPPLRVCVIDTRGELAYYSERRICLDVLSGYPRGHGIEIATRSMNAELIVCDEIGDIREAEAIISAQNSGVPFVATAHGESIDGLLRRTAVCRLHEARVFFAYVKIKRTGKGDFYYTVTEWEEADAILHGGRSRNSSALRA